ncbi:MAG: nucleotidyltransferase domain-containing protein [Melioribacteraceae bacterium]|nr:nucleotidyltransferase domain-containing protein [Melioribacteraceae bacterium]MCF8263900.1 nucleotidyltransferase domain-containing protein [Melioribacteraceae bacterium]MCF8430305.1 nucleotidyltransferase domain-containing protein [Melioribacteraceae bacterium]
MREYGKAVNSEFGVADVLLFGSRTGLNFNEHSDIDVAVIVDKIDGDYLSLVRKLYRISYKIDYKIEPRLFEKGNDPSGFLDEVLRTGIKIN